MSVLVSTWVWKRSQARGSELIVLLYLADKADDDGCNRWPRSVDRMARECRLSKRTLQNALRRLQASGQIRAVDSNEAGCKAYQLVMGAELAPETSLENNDGSSTVGSSFEAVVRDVLGADSAGVQILHPPDGAAPFKVCTACGSALTLDADGCPCEVFGT